MPHGPPCIAARIGVLLEKHEGFDPKTAARISECLNAVAKYGFAALPKKYLLKLGALMLKTRMTYEDGVRLYGKYIAGWGDKTTCWRFVAKNGGEAVAEVIKAPVSSVSLRVQTDTTSLREKGTWDMATLRFQAVDQNGNVLPYCSRIVSIQVEGVLELVGDPMVALSGGMAGAYLKTTGVPGTASVTLTCQGAAPVTLDFTVEV
jgi:beta-galactosidase